MAKPLATKAKALTGSNHSLVELDFSILTLGSINNEEKGTFLAIYGQGYALRCKIKYFRSYAAEDYKSIALKYL
ncbi:hypothetical protein CRP01_27255 [Flavilitoribacter nigricans DSM 23189 = NBRC 102662]|uniref:Uncharacterized protein n=1 Tax=Flavilitoribacter nigricans (strain ATCC 23147 / DSM 23189 / NBRC 102662 / NCIMB 1420 / SS-2) TaxID=1122177 RepID=A0A2D0N4F5_FLAN2|nr:hypothetical protein CRP01_27255 [Flavilitoribacter nigricans DSM 23189 = NBRC 102662]